MQSAMYVALSGQQVLQRQLEIVANNVANMNSAGFRAETVRFDSLLSTSEPDLVHFANIGETSPSQAQGTLTNTGNSLDVALSGPGWFAIETPSGVAYTRDGRLEMDPFGEIRSVAGHAVLDASQAPILANPNGGPLEITPDGQIRQDGAALGNIGVFELPEGSITARFENTAFFANVEGLPIAPGNTTKVLQGFSESSNVNGVEEIANLMAITRTFESLTSTLRDAENALNQAVRELGNSNG